MAHRKLSLGLVSLAIGMLQGSPRALAQGGYPQDAGTVVVRLQESLGELADADAGPSVEVYGDGAVRVHQPRHTKRAGEYALRLTRAELDGLVQSLEARGLLDFDAAATRRSKRDALASRRAAGQTVTVVSDPSLTVIEVRTDRGARRISWSGVEDDARQYPSVAALQNLAAARRQIRALMERSDLARE